jgi:cell wall-associated NlpC family hydrolase
MGGRRSWEYPASPPRRAWRAGRVATSLVFASLFFAGAALTAGAGNETVQADDAVAVEAPATEAADTVAADPAAEAPATEDPSAEAPPAADPPAEPAAAPAPDVVAAADPPAASEVAPDQPAEPATDRAATTDAAPPADAPAPAPDPATTPAPTPAATSASAAPVEASVVPARATTAPSAPATHRSSQKRRVAAKPSARRVPVPVAAAPVFYPTIPFDLKAWVHDNPASPVGATAVAIARHFLGTPYVWGGASPTAGFDCSGLALYVYAQLGIALPHYAAWQFAAFAKLDASQLEPGDLVFFEPLADGPGHVAIYAGNDTIIEAPHTGALVRVGSLSGSAAALGFLGAVRPYGAAASATMLFGVAPTVSHRSAVVGRTFNL